jgi:hypothetical protein
MQDKLEAAIDKTLSALGSATPPAGLEGRIQQRLRYHAAQPTEFDPASWLPGKNWWTGIVTGAALATLVCCALLAGLRWRMGDPLARRHSQTAAKSVSSGRPLPVSNASAPRQTVVPCPQLAVQRQPAHHALVQLVRAAAEPPKPPAAPAGDQLTPQERELVRLTHVADPKQLSTMSFDARAKAEAQESAAFQRFFTPPPPPPHDEGVNE